MAENNWIGLAEAVAQVDTLTVGGTIEAGDIFTITVTGLDGSTHEISFTATDTTIATVVAGLVEVWNASTNELCTPVTAVDDSPDIIMTADTAGVGFTVTVETTESDGGAADAQTFTRAATTANTGPNNWDNVDNWSLGVLPGAASGHEVNIEDAEIYYGLDQSGISNTLAELNILRCKIGVNPVDGASVIYFQIKATKVNLGKNTGLGSSTEKSPINLDTGATASTVYIYNTGSNSDTTMPAVRIKANSASTKVWALTGAQNPVGLAYEDDETATFGEIVSTGGNIHIGRGVTMTSLYVNGGTVHTSSGAGSIDLQSGTIKTYHDAAFTTVVNYRGLFESNATGTIGTLTAKSTVDFTKNKEPRTVTTAKLTKGGSIAYDVENMTFTNGIVPEEASGSYTVTAA